MSVDLSAGRQGIITFKNGYKYFCVSVNGDEDGYVVRIENGVYWLYTRDGNYGDQYEGQTEARVIINFMPCDRDDPRAAGLKTQACP